MPSTQHLFLSLALIVVTFTVALYSLDASHFNGIEDDQEKTFFERLLNRLYFCMTTISTVGYGDISPKSGTAKALVMVLHAIVLLAVHESMASALHAK